MGGKESKLETELFLDKEIICPKCPLTPIISISLNQEGILQCEYRCSFMHFGQIPLEDIIKDKENKHGKFCDRCVNKKEKEEKNNINSIKEELLYCGTCKQFICSNCLQEHNIQKESHKSLVKKSKLRYTCLEHKENYIGFCFTCLVDICKKCERHNKHCTKLFKEFYPDKDFLDNYKYYIGDFKDYMKSFKRSQNLNKEQFYIFKKRCEILLNLAKYLMQNFEEKKKKNILNGETLINLLNVVSFNFKAKNYETSNEFVNYCKTHLILSNKPISDICTFSKTKSDFNISKLILEEYKLIETTESQNPNCFKYSPIGNHIVYSLGTCVYFISAEEKEKNSFKIRIENQITSFNIINHNILCICSNKLFLYELLKEDPFYQGYKIPVLDLFNEPVLEIVGNLDKNIIVRTKKHLFILNDKKKKGEYEIINNTSLEDLNNIIKIKKEVPIKKKKKPYKTYDYYDDLDDDSDDDFDDYGLNYKYGNHKKTKEIEIIKKVITTLKTIFNEYLITIENGVITTRNLNDLKIVSTVKEHKNNDCLVFNGNVMLFDSQKIYFYSIPNLKQVSSITVEDDIISINIVNKKSFIVLENRYIEQFETKTWKRLWRQLSLGGLGLNTKNLSVIGAGTKLFFYNKEKKIIYQSILKSEEDKNKEKK